MSWRIDSAFSLYLRWIFQLIQASNKISKKKKCLQERKKCH